MGVKGNSDQRNHDEILAFPLPTASTDFQWYLERQKIEELFNGQIAPITINKHDTPDATMILAPPLSNTSHYGSQTRSKTSFRISHRSILQGSRAHTQISPNQTFPISPLTTAAAHKAPGSSAKAISTTTVASLVDERASMSNLDNECSKGSRLTTHSYRAWLTNLPQPAWTEVETIIKTNHRRHGRISPLPNEVLSANILEEYHWEQERRRHDAESSGDVQNIQSPPQDERQIDKPCLQTDTHGKSSHTPTGPTPDISVKTPNIQFQPFEWPHLYKAQSHLSAAVVHEVSQPTPIFQDLPKSPHTVMWDRPSDKIRDRRKEKDAPELLFNFSFDTEGPNLDFHLDFDIQRDLSINTANEGETMTKHMRAFKYLAYASPSTAEVACDLEKGESTISEMTISLLPASNKGTERDLEGQTHTPTALEQKLHTPKMHIPKAPSFHSSSGSSVSSASMLSWLPIREPLTPRFKYLRAVLEGNSKGQEEGLSHWPPEVRIERGG
jgi:hypothetical protein